ncbi:bifunctional riboflavin kinase/FAD synthetase [Luteolibacter yonseiensis]|uniref:Riboflavin biosynthesis protein n=1 Tax=Luteolibacter yonseiensis TaxID=1144680 RepID=A0A934R2I5_9BACT|nr:bifunctional riboflavin kinase/FAD synthetase [Luteolibacter yonseiensis]MBK1815654.1 bifunctional riboflavin kinase/FAD synthetase [Luteolibacter yonseiensis]
MLIRKHLEDLPALGAPLHLALGVFDGLHVGHQTVIARAVEAAKRDGGMAGVLTFDPHPIRVIAPRKAPTSLLETLEHKARAVGDYGVELFIPLHFDLEVAKMEASEFIERLMAAPVRTLAVGEDWRFGHNRGGDVNFLAAEAAKRGFTLEAVPPVMHEGERISSTRIRQAIRDGNLDAAARMLGRPYVVCGTVVEGRKLGRTIGFPTANLVTRDAQLPPDGVWAVRVRLPDGRDTTGVANLGLRPTVDGSNRALEVHLFDFSEGIYNQELEVRFEKHLRDEIRFPSLDALRSQIQQDAMAAREYFNSRS